MFPPQAARAARAWLTDIDDTLTDGGRLPQLAYAGLERLRASGLLVVPVTGRPAGWCDLIARQWPVDAVVGENGAFWFRYDQSERRMHRHFVRPQSARKADRSRLAAIAETVFADVPGSAYAADQEFRLVDIAIDFSEDVPALSRGAVDRIVAHFEQAGAKARVSSIHVNAWFGDHDKLTTSLDLLGDAFGIDARADPGAVIYSGDSPNDEPMFAHFPHAIGVANVLDFSDRMTALPGFVTENRLAAGFAEACEFVLAARGAR